MSIFNYYPYINYNNQKATHILCKAEVLSGALKDKRKFYNYTIKDGERADIIAFREYDDASLDWIIYLVNNIVDPYKDWPLTDRDFKKYMEKKYNKNAELLTSVLFDYSIAHYYYQGIATQSEAEIAAYNFTITKESYDALTIADKAGWVPKSIWDYENEINESKRDIVLLRPNYINDFTQLFKDLFING